jgi:hypothetical protein
MAATNLVPKASLVGVLPLKVISSPRRARSVYMTLFELFEKSTVIRALMAQSTDVVTELCAWTRNAFLCVTTSGVIRAMAVAASPKTKPTGETNH